MIVLMLGHRFLSLVNAVWAIPCVFIIRLIKPLIWIRIGKLYAGRIGHFVPDAAEHYTRGFIQEKKTLDFFYFFGAVTNEQWARMVRRNLKVRGGYLKYIWHWNDFLPGGSSHNLPQSYTKSRDLEGLFSKYDARFAFTEEENSAGIAWLKSKGWQDGEPFVCLLVRDAAFLKAEDAFGFHDYRDGDIYSYSMAIKWLTDQGVWVIRMGKVMATPLSTESKYAVDYAFDSTKSDLLDIWLFANCTGCMSTGTGPDWVSAIYKKPLLYINYSPLGLLISWVNAMTVPKNLKWLRNGKSLSLQEYLDRSYLSTSDYEKAEIEIIDLTPLEILAATQEFWQRITGTWQEQTDEKALQEASWDHFKCMPNFPELHGWKNPESRIGYAWLSSMDDTFLGA